MKVLFAFAGLALCCTAVSSLLPEGGLKKTASLALSLMLTVLWLDTLRDSWPSFRLPASAGGLLERITQGGLDNVLEEHAASLAAAASVWAGSEVAAAIDTDGAIILSPSGGTDAR